MLYLLLFSLYTMEPAHLSDIDGDQTIDVMNATSRSDEDINLIFYFVFLLEEFSTELNTLVRACEVIRQQEVQIQESKKRVWWKKILYPYKTTTTMNRIRRKRGDKSNSFWKSVYGLFVSSTTVINLPSTRAHQENTKQTPLALTSRERFNRIVWKLGQFLKEPETKFAIKAGLGSAILASPAFIKSTRHQFMAYKGQWALVSFMVVLSPTVGQSNQMSIHRILGTLLGAGAAILAYWIFPDDNVALPIFGALFTIPCFWWIIGKPQLASSGRFVLLTFNLTALYSYNLRKVGIEVDEIAYHRTVAVIVGVVWATILNHLVWPYEARRELSRGLSDLLFKLGFLYQQVALSYSSKEEEIQPLQDNCPDEEELEEQPLLAAIVGKKEVDRRLELNLQIHLIKLEGLLSLTKHEPRLKGPFPVDTYKQFLGCCQNILDLLHTMNQVTSRNDWHTRVRRDFIVPIDHGGKRREMVGNVGLFFWLLASAFHLKTPLPPFLPPAEVSRLQVLHAIRELPVVKKRAIHGSSEVSYNDEGCGVVLINLFILSLSTLVSFLSSSFPSWTSVPTLLCICFEYEGSHSSIGRNWQTGSKLIWCLGG